MKAIVICRKCGCIQELGFQEIFTIRVMMEKSQCVTCPDCKASVHGNASFYNNDCYFDTWKSIRSDLREQSSARLKQLLVRDAYPQDIIRIITDLVNQKDAGYGDIE